MRSVSVPRDHLDEIIAKLLFEYRTVHHITPLTLRPDSSGEYIVTRYLIFYEEAGPRVELKLPEGYEFPKEILDSLSRQTYRMVPLGDPEIRTRLKLPTWWPDKLMTFEDGNPKPALDGVRYAGLRDDDRFLYNPECVLCNNTGKVSGLPCPEMGCVWTQLKPVCSVDGCHRRRDCGPHCRNRN